MSRSPLGAAQLGAALEDGVTGKPQEALKHEITNKWNSVHLNPNIVFVCVLREKILILYYNVIDYNTLPLVNHFNYADVYRVRIRVRIRIRGYKGC